MVTNLVKNAVEAMDERGTLTCTVDVEHATGPGAARFARIVVEDTGPGIAPEVRGRLFTPYVTTKGSRGTGLGLALAHRIVVEHGGSIEVASAVHSATGAAFIVRLPLVRTTTSQAPELPAHDATVSGA